MNKRYDSLEDIMTSALFDEIVTLDKRKVTSYDPEVEKFNEIIQFYKKNGYEPQKTTDPTRLSERGLASRLNGIRNDPERIAKLKEYDEEGLLEPQKFNKEIESLDDILNFGSSALLDGSVNRRSEVSIFNTARFREVENKPDYVAKRKQMKNFDIYEPLFRQIQQEIAEGKRKVIPFKNYDIKKGSFLIQKGILLYIDSVGAFFKTDNGEDNARLHVIYENGTESNVLLRSLAANLYRTGSGGKMVTDNIEELVNNIKQDDISSGYIYVLRSLSDDPQLKSIDDLYKIGVTTGSVERRIANAVNESTYLYAPVEIVTKYHVYNLNAGKLEKTLHKLLENCRLDVEIVGVNGRMIVPREWFIIPLKKLNTILNELIAKLNS
ncbi:GIY-YIG nuclease family protein [Enterococcus hulanensis]|uniref:GIY-YIG nuclease family protein n=1 Tax=Enterococcus hulanensis TaxID=2559929 RepID=UPI001A8F7DC2|nr:GIY-YIG nuclease family protein [Enterococcus hulanensis]MBO0455700.1 GIY-YIG nuclease family protein [Enterococcus hulanensis]